MEAANAAEDFQKHFLSRVCRIGRIVQDPVNQPEPDFSSAIIDASSALADIALARFANVLTPAMLLTAFMHKLAGLHGLRR